MKNKFKFVVLMCSSFLLFACGNTEAKNTEESEEVVEVVEEPEETLSFEWAGEYYGVLPCADCEGIETLIELHNNLTYDKTLTYQSEDSLIVEDEGGIEWDDVNKIITLISMNDTIFYQYKYEDTGIRALDIDGNEISGDLADAYILNKK